MVIGSPGGPIIINYVAKTLGYQARLNGYITLLVDEYPPFDLGEHPEYPVRLHIGPPQEQSK